MNNFSWLYRDLGTEQISVLGSVSKRRQRKHAAALSNLAFLVGVVPGGDGTTPSTGRQGKTGEAIVGQVHGKYYESSSRGAIFNACDQGVGVAVTQSQASGFGTGAMLSLYNPPNSGKRLSVTKVSAAYFSGTLGAGLLYHCMNPVIAGTAVPAAPTSGTALTAFPSDIGNQSGAAAVGVARSAPTVTTPTAIRPFVSFGAELASTANGLQPATEDIDGEFVIEPGSCYQLQFVGANGSSPKVSLGISWEEIPIVATQG